VIGGLVYVSFFSTNVLAAIVGAGTTVVGGCMYFIFQKNWKNNDKNLIKIIKQQPEKILWVYTLETNLMPFGFKVKDKGLIYFKMNDGEDVCIKMPAKDLKLVSRFLNRLLPNAMFGFSEEKQRLYNEQLTMSNEQ
jgi:hypothetical protein